MYDGIQNAIKNSEELQEKLANPNLTKDEKNTLLREISSSVAKELNIKLADVSTIATDKQTVDGEEIQGGYHQESGDIAINDKNINNTGEAMNTLGHEIAHSLDSQRGESREGTTESGQSYSDEYANIMGDSLQDYAEFGMWNYSDGKTLATTNTHNGLTPSTSVFSPNYNQETQNFENRVDGGEVEFRQLAQEEINHIKTVSKEYAQQKGISENEAYNKLYDSAMYAVDKDSRRDNAPLTKKQQEQGFISATNEKLQDINEDIAYLRESSKGKEIFDVYDEGNMKTQDMFTATKAQLNNPSHTPDSSIGLEDNSLVILPVIRVGDKVIKTTAVATKATASKADDIILNTGIKVDNLIQNTVAPTVKDGYYRTANVVVNPENIAKTTIVADTIYGGLSDEPPVTGAQLIGNRINAWIVQPIIKDLDMNDE